MTAGLAEMKTGGEAAARPAQCCVAWGLSIRTELPLPELLPAAFSGEPDIEIVRGEVPGELAGATRSGVRFQATDERLLLRVDGVARYLAEHGRRIVIDCVPGADEADVRLFLLGTVCGTLLEQRRDLVFHGSAVDIGGAAAVFLGFTGAGKSTVAALLRDRGRAVLTDEICVMREGEDGCLAVQPGFPQLHLWPDAIAQLGARPDDFSPLRRVNTKRAVPLGAAFRRQPLPVRIVCEIAGWNREEIRVARLTGPAVVEKLSQHGWHIHGAERPADAAHFHRLLRLARQARFATVTRPIETFRLAQLAAELERVLTA